MATVLPLHPMDVYPRLDAEQACLLLLTKPGCGVCAAMVRALGRTPVALPVFEVDVEGAPGLVDEHEAFHLPALFLYQAGQLSARLWAPPVVEDLAAELGDLLGAVPSPS